MKEDKSGKHTAKVSRQVTSDEAQVILPRYVA